VWKNQFKAATGRDFLMKDKTDSDTSIGSFDSCSD
jgi:hypothetical protein